MDRLRDLCPWIVTLAERNQPGIYNAAGPVTPVTWEQVIQDLVKLAPQPVQLRWATTEVLEKTGMQLPLVRTPFFGRSAPHFAGTAAQSAGLVYRPLADTAAATLAWWRSQTAERRANAEGWPKPEQEQEALRLLAGNQKVTS